MKTRRSFYLTITITAFFAFFSFTVCKTNAQTSGKSKKSTQEVLAPCSGPEFYSTPTSVSASSMGEDKEQRKAKQLALKTAREDLEMQIREAVNFVVADDYNSNNKNLTGTTKRQFEIMIRPFIKEQVAKYNLTCEQCVEKRGKYKCYVAIGVDVNEITQLLHQKLTDEEQILRIDYDLEKFREKFNEAIEKELEKQIAREGKTLSEHNKIMQRKLANKNLNGHYISLGSSIFSSGYYGTVGAGYEYRYNLFGFNAAIGYSFHDIWRETESLYANAGVKLYFAKKKKVLRNLYFNFLPLSYYGGYPILSHYYTQGEDYDIILVHEEKTSPLFGAGLFLGYSPVWHVNKKVALGFNVGIGTKISYKKGHSAPINWDLGFVVKF
ncbi:MAG: hypothetical protein FWC34_02485 [Bacteroidetes bacterium]|nr:hypothetical protein [Bacteroidota bacterium]MCL2303546.1 hypothetical protein [Lentimicrobiaceae bacterium]